jgi:hypothetical protein
VLGLAGCAASPALRAARRGDRAALRASVGTLGRAEIREVAEAVAAREIASGRGPDAVARIDEAKSCAYSLADALEQRMRSTDEVGAAATLALLDAGPRAASGIDRTSLVARAATSSEPLWRAAAARASREARAHYFVDPDERVRIAALRSALEKPDAKETADLLEVARLDPNALAESLAVRALGGIGGARVVLALRDRYERAPDDLRAMIVVAWATPASAAGGGRAQIVRVAETASGLAAIEAGVTLLGTGGDKGGIGLAALVRATQNGPSSERAAAIARLPLGTPEAKRAIERAATVEDVEVRTAALTRLLDLPDARAKALGELRRVADGGARIALGPLARAGDRTALDALRHELSAPRPGTRLSAGRDLVAAGAFGDAAMLLADDDPHVRTTAACTIILAAR